MLIGFARSIPGKMNHRIASRDVIVEQRKDWKSVLDKPILLFDPYPFAVDKFDQGLTVRRELVGHGRNEDVDGRLRHGLSSYAVVYPVLLAVGHLPSYNHRSFSSEPILTESVPW